MEQAQAKVDEMTRPGREQALAATRTQFRKTRQQRENSLEGSLASPDDSP